MEMIDKNNENKLTNNPYLSKEEIDTFFEYTDKWIQKVDIGSLSQSMQYVQSEVEGWLRHTSIEDVATVVKLINENKSWVELSEQMESRSTTAKTIGIKLNRIAEQLLTILVTEQRPTKYLKGNQIEEWVDMLHEENFENDKYDYDAYAVKNSTYNFYKQTNQDKAEDIRLFTICYPNIKVFEKDALFYAWDIENDKYLVNQDNSLYVGTREDFQASEYDCSMLILDELTLEIRLDLCLEHHNLIHVLTSEKEGTSLHSDSYELTSSEHVYEEELEM